MKYYISSSTFVLTIAIYILVQSLSGTHPRFQYPVNNVLKKQRSESFIISHLYIDNIQNDVKVLSVNVMLRIAEKKNSGFSLALKEIISNTK